MGKILNIAVSIGILLYSSITFSEESFLKIPLHAAHITLDPTGIQDISSLFVSRQINCQLIRSYGSISTLDAAESIHYQTSQKILIKLKPNIFFQDGLPVTAEDVLASFEHLKKSRQVLRNVFNWISNIEIINHKELVINLKGSVPQFLSVLSSPNYAIFEKEFLIQAEKNPILWRKPIGCGNYKIIKNENNDITLQPINEGKPIEFKLISSDQLDRKDLNNYDISDLKLVGNESKITGYSKISIFDPTQIFIGLNLKSNKWKTKSKRCEFLSKLTSNHILELYGKAGKPATDILPEGILGYQYTAPNQPRQFSIKKPKTKENFCLSLLTVSIPKAYRESYVKMVKGVYPNIKIKYLEDNKHFGINFVESKCDAIILGLKSNTLDGYDILAVFSEMDPNFTGFYSKEITKKIENSQNEPNPTLRYLLYRNIVNEIRNKCLVSPILTIPMKTVYVKKNLYTPNIGKGPLNEYYLGQVR